MPLYLYDDAQARGFEPFALTRPASELRAGALLTRERWALLVGEPAAGFLGAAHLTDFEEGDAPPAVSSDTILPAGAILANARFLPAPGQSLGPESAWTGDGHVAAVRLRAPLAARELADGTAALATLALAPRGTAATLDGRWVREVWEYVRDLVAQLTDDIRALGPQLDTSPPNDAIVLEGAHGLYIERGATVEPHAFFDVRAGPILVRRGATVHAFTRAVGPLYVGERSSIAGDRVAACAIGEHSRVHGEISNAIILGHSNKSHDGFVGHSYLGRWVNLGAGTITSNLKNTYGPVQIATPDGTHDTGMTFLGSLIGDYARTGIGTRLTTGTVVGAGANLFPVGVAPKWVPPFAWGEGGGGEAHETFQLEKFLEVAARQMARRDVELSAGARRQLAAAHRRAGRR